ncbi:hypothetical protein R3I93_021337 [Phoxinus phoxinus]|uniref:Uncharacterized protein n=1 Tax=Phoxinus phoxinus TaxID=58324 RepID=A0AAN9GTN3_9TELE
MFGSTALLLQLRVKFPRRRWYGRKTDLLRDVILHSRRRTSYRGGSSDERSSVIDSHEHQSTSSTQWRSWPIRCTGRTVELPMTSSDSVMTRAHERSHLLILVQL